MLSTIGPDVEHAVLRGVQRAINDTDEDEDGTARGLSHAHLRRHRARGALAAWHR